MLPPGRKAWPVAWPSSSAGMSETKEWKGLQRRHLYLFPVENSIRTKQKEREVKKCDSLSLIVTGVLILILVKINGDACWPLRPSHAHTHILDTMLEMGTKPIH